MTDLTEKVELEGVGLRLKMDVHPHSRGFLLQSVELGR